MADTYIDYYEVSEYGRYFVREAARLESASGALVDIAELRSRVLTAVEAVENRLDALRTRTSTLRSGRGGADGATDEMRDALRRFYYYLKSLPGGTPMDMQAFYPGGNLGRTSTFKAEDLLARADEALRGFDSPANADLPAGETWRDTLSDARTALAEAIDDKGSARSDGHASTGELAAARQHFLHVYNRVAKRLVRGVLADLDREHEYQRFFRDLQLSEGANAQPPSPPPATTGDTIPTA